MGRQITLGACGLKKYADAIGAYACHQIDSGAQLIQVFESWAHHQSPEDFVEFGRPYANMVADAIKAKHPDVPVIFYANGGSGFLEEQTQMYKHFDVISLDWHGSMATGRKRLGGRVAGNLDPHVLLVGDNAAIEEAVKKNIQDAGGSGRHVLNVGHGVPQGTREESIAAFVRGARSAAGISEAVELPKGLPVLEPPK